MASDMKILSRAYEIFDSANEMSSDRFRKKLLNLIGDDEFLMAIFRPRITEEEPKEALSAKIAQVYDVASKRSVISVIAEALSDHGYYSLMRPSATFLVTLVNLGMATIDTKATDLGRMKDHNEISDREFNRNMEKLTRYQDDLEEIVSYARKIVKGSAKSLARKTGLPKSFCASSLFSVPGVNYVDTYKVGFYLKTVLGNLYGMVNNDPNEFEVDFDEVQWKQYFSAIFGAQRLPDIASMILLEGAESIKRYEDNYHDVKECWDSITNFALKTLNQAPTSIRDQMIELYLKRLNKMFADHNLDLRVDLRTIDSLRFDNLWDTIKRYKGKFDEVMAKAKNYLEDDE